MLTLKNRLDLAGNNPAGFDYLRLMLSAAVIGWHAYSLSYGTDVALAVPDPIMSPVRLIVASFFALGGFLVAGSLERCRTFISFIGLRILRIVPALAVEVLVSAVLLGGIVTTLKWQDYYAHPEFWQHLTNIFGGSYHELPGVFADNPIPSVVNQQLWTIPWEFWCYSCIAVLWLFGMAKKPKYFLLATVLATLYVMRQGIVSHTVHRIAHVPTYGLVVTFMWGVAFYFYRARIPHSAVLASVAALFVYVALMFDRGGYFVAAPLAYVIAYLGTLDPRRNAFIRSGDYSYGLYLWGFPIQQLLASVGGVFAGAGANFLGSLLLGLLCAYFSWNYVESPAGRLRKYAYKIESLFLGFGSRVIGKTA